MATQVTFSVDDATIGKARALSHAMYEFKRLNGIAYASRPEVHLLFESFGTREHLCETCKIFSDFMFSGT